MEQKINNKITLKDKLISFYQTNKYKIFVFTSILTITFSNSDNEKLKNVLIELINSKKTEKEIENESIKSNSNLVKNIVENSNLKIIVNKKNYDQIKELFEDFTSDLIKNQNRKKIESLENKLINNMEEKAYSELLKLKSQINRE